MSSCSCSNTHVRVSDEGTRTGADGRTAVRLRCLDCGGKAGYLSLHALETLGFPKEDARKAAEPGALEPSVEITVKGWEWPTPVADTGLIDPKGEDDE